MNIQWKNATTRPSTHHAFQLTEELTGRLHSVNAYEFKFDHFCFITDKTDTLYVGDWVVRTEKGFEYLTQDEFKRLYLEPT